MQTKIARGWKGARFQAIFLRTGLLLCVVGIPYLAAGLYLVGTGGWPVRELTGGVYLTGLGALILIGHPIVVVLARCRWHSWMRGRLVAGPEQRSTDDERKDQA